MYVLLGGEMTHGLAIFARSMTPATPGAGRQGFQHGNHWQYHPRSDRHSQIICWAVAFDLLVRNNRIREHVLAGKVAFGVNHTMTDFHNNRKKDLDLVLCRRTEDVGSSQHSFRDIARKQGVLLRPEEQDLLDQLPSIPIVGVKTALIALEAKAAMTEFGKARPRLYDELNSSHLTIHGDTDSAIAAGLAIINVSDSFVSPTRNHWTIGGSVATLVSEHKQPKEAELTLAKVLQLPRRSSTGGVGFDALAAVMVKVANDATSMSAGTPVEIVLSPPAPRSGDPLNYDSFIERIEAIYAARWGNI